MDDVLLNLKSSSELQAEKEAKAQVPEATPQTEDSQVEVADTEDPEQESEEEETEEEETGEPGEEKEGKPSTKEAPWGKPGLVPKGVADRFAKLTTKVRELEKKNEQLEHTWKKVSTFFEQQTQQRMPTKQDFLAAGKTEDDYIAFLVQVQARQQVAALDQQREKQSKIRSAAEEINAKWTTNFEKAKADLHDYDEVVGSVKVQLPVDTVRYLATSELGPYISYTIAKRPDIQKRINALSVGARHAVVLEVETMVKQWLAAKKAPVSTGMAPKQAGVQPAKAQAPAPLRAPKKTQKGTGKKLDPASASIEEWLGIE